MNRNLPGPIRLELGTPDIGRPFYRAVTTLDALALIEEPPPTGAEGGSNSLRRWDSFQMPHEWQMPQFAKSCWRRAKVTASSLE